MNDVLVAKTTCVFERFGRIAMHTWTSSFLRRKSFYVAVWRLVVRGTYYCMIGDVRGTPAKHGNVDAKMDRILYVSYLFGIIHAVIDSAIAHIFSR